MCGRALTEKECIVGEEENSTTVLWKIAEPTNRRADNMSSVYSNNQNFSFIKGEMPAAGKCEITTSALPAPIAKGV